MILIFDLDQNTSGLLQLWTGEQVFPPLRFSPASRRLIRFDLRRGQRRQIGDGMGGWLDGWLPCTPEWRQLSPSAHWIGSLAAALAAAVTAR